MAQQMVKEYAAGDWVVHYRHGVGQVKGIDVKEISGEEKRYYKIKMMNDSTMWLPIRDFDDEWLRPLSTKEELQEVIDILSNPPKTMANNHNTRKTRIRRVKSDYSLQATARLVRDLWGRQKKKGKLTQTEKDALKRVTDELLHEWSVCMSIDISEARKQLHALLN